MANLRHIASIAIASLALALSIGAAASAAPVSIRLHVDYAELNEALKQQMYSSDNGRAQLWNGDNACQYLYAENPRFGRREAKLKLETDGYLNLGLPLADKCVNPLTWSGIIELENEPYISGLALKLHVTNVNLYDRNHQKSLLVGHGFDLIKSNLIPRLQTFSFDLGPAVGQLEGLALVAVTADNAAQVRAAFATVRLEAAVAVEDNGIALTLDMNVPEEQAAPSPAVSAGPLTPAEAAAWQAGLENWDAFIVFAIKQIGETVPDPQLRAQLFDVLIDSRERLVGALAQPQSGVGPDPVRILFIDEWTRLHAIVEAAAQRGLLGNRALELLSFILAGDALFALDQAAPALGMRISADDLRRLSRILAPHVRSDPLTYSFEEDPELRQIFGMPAPLEMLGPLDTPDESLAAPRISPAGAAAPAGPAPTPSSNPQAPSSPGPAAAPTPETGGASAPLSMLSILAAGPREAFGAEPAPTPQMILELGHKLRDVVVNQRNQDRYRAQLAQLLNLAAEHETNSGSIDPQFDTNYLLLVKAVAWQESCWRQFVILHDRVSYLESKSGDLGLMQVNKYVWRGFYSLPRLKWDIVYNASAGCEILTRLLQAAKRHDPASFTKDTDNLARSVYSAYNGGPAAYDRWRGAKGSSTGRAADQAFWLKYRAMREGQAFDLVRCAMDWDRTHGQ